MATYTTNFNLEKPAQNEAVDVDVLNSNSDIIDDNLGQVKQLALNIGYGYNNAVPYLVGDYCVYQNKLYKCIQDILIPEDFNISKWQQCSLANELQNIKGNPDGNITETLTKLQIGNNIYKIEEGANENIAETYDATSTYAVGDYVIYHNVLYKCTTTVSVAEPFDSNKWTECLVTDELGSGSGGSGGHTILDNNGDALTQRDEMQFVGTYSEDDSTNEITKVNIVREMTKAEFDLLSDDEKIGIINVTDEAGIASVINGVFIDTDNVIISLTEYKPSMTYTATEDCYIVLYTVFGSNTTIHIDSEIVGNFDGSGNFGITNNFYLKKGQTISVTNASSSYNSYYIVYGIQQGSNQGAEIDDATPSSNTVYSSEKVESLIPKYKMGNVSFTSGSYDGNTSVVFDVPFDSANYNVFLDLSLGGAGFADIRYMAVNRTESGFNIYVYTSRSVAAFGIAWIAIPFE